MARALAHKSGGLHLVSHVRDVVRVLGGTDAVAALTGRSPQAVSNWIAENRIAPRLFLRMTTALEARGHTAPPELWSQEAAEAA